MKQSPIKFKKQFLDIPAMEVWLKMKCGEVTTKKKEGITYIYCGEEQVFEPIHGYGEDKVTTEDLRHFAMMSKYSIGHSLTPVVGKILDDYSDMMAHYAFPLTIWSVADLLTYLEPSIKVTIDRSKIVSGFGPKLCPIQRVPLNLGDKATITIVCTGNLPNIACPKFRVVEALLLSELDPQILQKVIPRLG